MTKQSVEEALKRLSTIWPMPSEKNERYDDWLSVYVETLGGLPDEALENGVGTMLRRRASGWFPKPGEIMEFVEPYLQRRSRKSGPRRMTEEEQQTDSVATLRAIMRMHLGRLAGQEFVYLRPDNGEEVTVTPGGVQWEMLLLATTKHEHSLKRKDELGDWYRREWALAEEDNW